MTVMLSLLNPLQASPVTSTVTVPPSIQKPSFTLMPCPVAVDTLTFTLPPTTI